MKIWQYFILLFTMTSCVSAKKFMANEDDTQYINNVNYKNLYVVDSIKIENPIVMVTNNGNYYVMSKTIFESYSKKERNFFFRPDVFLFETLLPMALPSAIFSKYAHGTDCGENMVRIDKKIAGINGIYNYKQDPNYFLLILIRGDFYNQCYVGLSETKSIKFFNKYSYYKVAIPCCENNNPKPKITPKYYPPTSIDSLIAK